MRPLNDEGQQAIGAPNGSGRLATSFNPRIRISAMKPESFRTFASVAALLSCMLAVAAAPQPIDNEVRNLLPDQIDPLTLSKLPSSVFVDPDLIGTQGNLDVIVKLKSPPLAMVSDEISPSARMEHKALLQGEQSAFMERTGTSSKAIACVQTLLNAVFLKSDASEVDTLAADPGVMSIYRSRNYQMSLSETVPYIGATKVQQQGFDGTGIKVAVLDSGIDYTHAAFGGEGTVEGFEKAYNVSVTSRDGLFPTEKIIEGFDFVGESWPDTNLLPDNDPIDINGHGTAVADIISAVAPGASLYAVKVCSAISSNCSDIAIVQGLEYAIDPNGDGDTSDAVDIVNMSLGGSYGVPYDDPLSQATNALSALGVLIVASAGNSGDKPFVTGTPSSASGALSVAQTQVPSASLQFLNVAEVDYSAVFLPWSKQLEEVIGGPVQYGDGLGGNLDGCADFESGSLDGKVVLVDRGECNFTVKVSKIQLGGGIVAVIGLIAPGAPFAVSDGGDRPVDIPSYMISQADADAMKTAGPDSIATLDPDNKLPLVMQIVGSSSRGPQPKGGKSQEPLLLKPEIGAPGASVAAVAGSGSGTAPFGGTSGAAPMISGSAALLLQKYPFLTPYEVKARLMNNAEINIDTDPFVGLAPITRIGAGEVRVDRSLTARGAAWDDDSLQGGLSFGFIDVSNKVHELFKRIRIRNYSDDIIEYSITPTFRYADDRDSGAVTLSTVFPGKVRVGAKEDRTVSVVMSIRGELLPDNFLSSGAEGANGEALVNNEYDGYFVIDDGVQPIHMPWHVLPRKAANVTVENTELDFTEKVATVDMTNDGVGDAQLDTFALLAVSPNLPEGAPGEMMPRPDIKAVGVKTIEANPEICSGSSFIWAFAISTWERQQHLFPVTHAIYLDIDQDGTDDYALFNSDAAPSGAPDVDGRQVALSVELTNFTSSVLFFAEHSMNTGNTVLHFCAEQVGLSQMDLLSTNVDIRVETKSTFYKGDPGDFVEGITITPGGERYTALAEDLGPNQMGTVSVLDNGTFEGNSDELGVMMIANADRGPGKRGGATQESELILLLA